ncbi:DUF305 domain-containing protein [Rhodococcus ruber]|uniref:DUF305 domain-containing protein n=1 Tax=Rhodococcus TaxID=1827 RepID=UPI0002D21BD8|nr:MULTISPECIES: DUF305 domain-containing protein [Rhodococcus]AUM19267.1 DUF305 domain-containing protein [Rhodococcus ruber]AXY49759.1 hypothetical protein YT1_0302 [Rhodococcus ruber]MBD8057103.1 DUF305 domain-containing protein [Rhodococcus ruber]MBP2214279.1 uncharacterized protein (DUF305 family) [Rhodococcus ruber]MCD2129733.1 DUF305 domain-containing protein [Rhodococcus ruber]
MTIERDLGAESAAESASHGRRRRRVPAAVAVLTLLGGLVLGIGGTLLVTSTPAPPGEDSIDVGFAQDMSIHHSQAVEMSAMALTNSADPAVRTLAYDVITTQQSQLGTMQGWLTLWNRSQLPTGEPMRWMRSPTGTSESMPGMDGHATMSPAPTPVGSPMPGMATTAELDALRRTTGPAFDTLYLQLLLRHHQGGLPMARHAAATASEAAVAALAQQITETQEAEAATMTQLLAARGATPLPMN